MESRKDLLVKQIDKMVEKATTKGISTKEKVLLNEYTLEYMKLYREENENKA